MHLEEFSEGKSILHNMDPRVKIIIFMIFSIQCLISSGWKMPLFYLLYPSLLIFIGKIKIRPIVSRILFANFFIFFIWLFVPFSYTGDPYLKIGPFSASREGLNYALSITFKCNAIILATITLLSTSSLFSLAHALIHFKMPGKLVSLFFLFYRYITVIHEEYLKIRIAASLRGFIPSTNIHTYRTYAFMIGGIIVKSYERAEDIYRAMLCRGFKGYFPLLEHFETKRRDIIFFILSLSLFFFLLFKGL
jgi:cobalt/nickel transport system permease protein